jgi:alkylation response protein AidB-like acyl-CoA dehydrogenase
MSQMTQVKIQTDWDLSWLRRFVKEVIRPNSVKAFQEGVFDRKIYESLHQEGILQAITPKEYGGREAKVSDLIWIVRELGYGSPGVAATFIGNMLGYSTVVLYGRPELREKICTRYQKNFGLWSFGMTEGVCGSDLMKTSTQAKRVPGGFLLSGEKNFITNSAVSQDLGIFANVLGAGGKFEGISCFYIPGDSPGLMRGAVMDKMVWRDSITGTLILKDIFVPEEHLLGNVGDGLKILTHCLNRSKTLLAASGVGLSLRALDLVKERMNSLERYGKPLGAQPVIRHEISRMHTEVEAAWMLTCLAASTWDSGDVAIREASMAKWFSGHTAVKVTGQAVELFGARGLFNEFEVSRLWRDAKGIEIVEGPSFVQELLIAKQVFPNADPSKETKVDPYKLTTVEKKVA